MALAAIAAVAALGLTSCAVGTGGAGDSDAEYDADAELSGTMTVTGFGTPDELGTTRMEIAEESLGDVDVNMVEGGFDVQQFLSAVASGEPPELIYAPRDQIGSLAARGAIIPLDRCIEGEGIDTSAFVQSALDQVTLDGQVYGIPEFNQVQITMADAELLSQAGLSIEDVGRLELGGHQCGHRGTHEGRGR